MNREWAKEKAIDRSGWAPGPWDTEPDYYEWDTKVGYPAFMIRLESGAWCGIIEAPYPTEGIMSLAFSHTLRDKRWNQMTHSVGMVSKTDVEGVGQHCISMEHWESPGPAYGGRTWNRGPYKTLEEVKQICEDVAGDIFDLHATGSYKDYFER